MEPLDWSSLRENCAGDESLVNEVLELFRKEADALLNDVKAAVVARDALAIKRSAHRLKGAVVSLGARPCVEASRALELAGSGGELSSVDALYEVLAKEMARLLTVIAMPHAA
jgi:HPt (histidine-containing phosphotransfer) domain-containing protein